MLNELRVIPTKERGPVFIDVKIGEVDVLSWTDTRSYTAFDVPDLLRKVADRLQEMLP
jgi:hypothetical protein